MKDKVEESVGKWNN